MIARLRAKRRSLRQATDDGFSLTEMIVTMSIMSIFMAIFTGSVIQLFSASNKVEAITQSTSQLNIAFQRIDKQARYASAISAPNTVATTSTGPWYVEFVNTTSGSDACTQLRYQDGMLSERRWTGTPVTAVDFTPVVSELLPSTTTPFTFYPATGTQTTQRLTLNFAASAGTTGTSALSVTFAAMNSNQASATNDQVTLVCQNAGGRP